MLKQKLKQCSDYMEDSASINILEDSFESISDYATLTFVFESLADSDEKMGRFMFYEHQNSVNEEREIDTSAVIQETADNTNCVNQSFNRQHTVCKDSNIKPGCGNARGSEDTLGHDHEGPNWMYVNEIATRGCQMQKHGNKGQMFDPLREQDEVDLGEGDLTEALLQESDQDSEDMTSRSIRSISNTHNYHGHRYVESLDGHGHTYLKPQGLHTAQDCRKHVNTIPNKDNLLNSQGDRSFNSDNKTAQYERSRRPNTHVHTSSKSRADIGSNSDAIYTRGESKVEIERCAREVSCTEKCRRNSGDSVDVEKGEKRGNTVCNTLLSVVIVLLILTTAGAIAYICLSPPADSVCYSHYFSFSTFVSF